MDKGLIHKFTVKKTILKDKTVERENKETGETETVTTQQKVKVPVEVSLMKPSRRMIDEAEIFYSVELSNAVKKGILTKAMLVKKYADTGGTLTEDETKDMLRTMKEYNDLKNEYQLLKTKNEDPERQKELEEKMLFTNRQILELEASLQGVYQHTADARAERAKLVTSSSVNKDAETPDFTSMTKKEIDLWAEENLGLSLDRRKTKAELIQTIQDNL